MTDTTHFGFETVPTRREGRPGAAGIRLGRHALRPDERPHVRRPAPALEALRAVAHGLRPGQRALDVAGGTGDLAAGLCRQVGAQGRVCLTDINAAMLEQGRERLVDRGIAGNVSYVQADAERLPFRDESFHCVTIGFGLRNVTDKLAALKSMARTLRPGGRLLVLEFSKPVLPLLAPAYDAYSFRVLPVLGRLVADDEASYRYLAESIRMHPDQETLAALMREAGLEDSRLLQPERRHRGPARRLSLLSWLLSMLAEFLFRPFELLLNRGIGQSTSAQAIARLSRAARSG